MLNGDVDADGAKAVQVRLTLRAAAVVGPCTALPFRATPATGEGLACGRGEACRWGTWPVEALGCGCHRLHEACCSAVGQLFIFACVTRFDPLVGRFRPTQKKSDTDVDCKARLLGGALRNVLLDY